MLRHRILPALFVALAAGCDGNDLLLGRMEGRLDGEPWLGPAYTETGPADGPVLITESVTAQGTRRIYVNLPAGLPASGPGQYPLGPGDASYVSTPHGGGDPYVAHAVSGALVIASRTGDLRGGLEVAFQNPGGAPIEFTDGQFVARR